MIDIAGNINSILQGLPAGTSLVAVSKFRPLEELEAAYSTGQRAFAESRPAEFFSKVKALPEDILWHFIGHLQTNKLKLVVPYASLIHSVDSFHLLDALQEFCAANGMRCNVLLEVHVAQEESKQGFSEDEMLAADWEHMQNARYPDVRICGIMGMASNTDCIRRIDADFSRIKDIFDKVKRANPGLTGFKELSIGMSHDWKIALKHGATMVRIGSAIFTGQEQTL